MLLDKVGAVRLRLVTEGLQLNCLCIGVVFKFYLIISLFFGLRYTQVPKLAVVGISENSDNLIIGGHYCPYSLDLKRFLQDLNKRCIWRIIPTLFLRVHDLSRCHIDKGESDYSLEKAEAYRSS